MDNLHLMSFSGDASISTPVKHGNSKSQRCHPRNPIAPSLARTLEASSDKPAAAYDKLRMSATSADDQRFKVPMNKRQITNLQANYRLFCGQSDIEMILVRLSKEYKCFQLYVVAPRVVLVLANPMMISYAKDILKIS